MLTEQTKILLAARRKLIPVTRWNKHHPWPPIGGLRYLIFNAESNGFSHCIRRVGRTVLIDEAKFFEWVDAVNQREARGPREWTQMDLLEQLSSKKRERDNR